MLFLKTGNATAKEIKSVTKSSLINDEYSGQGTMNGFALKDFENFQIKWPMITVRFREDTKEMRFVYANEVALQALKDKKTDYPDGAVFGKIGFISEPDPAFVSSIVPSGAKRYQFMVRDKKKFASTGGWGYVLFNAEGKTFTGNPDQNSLACMACHNLVPNRGYIFSEPASFSTFTEEVKKLAKNQVAHSNQSFEFKSTSRSQLNEKILYFIPSKFKKIRMLQGALQKNMFEGTANEVGPLLSQESIKSNLATVLINDDRDIFAFAYPQETSNECALDEKRVVFGRSVASASKSSNEAVVRVVSHCAKRITQQ